MRYEPGLVGNEERLKPSETWLRLLLKKDVSGTEVAPTAFALSTVEKSTTQTLSGARCSAEHQNPVGAFEDAEVRKPGHYEAVGSVSVAVVDKAESACIEDAHIEIEGTPPHHAFVDFRNHDDRIRARHFREVLALNCEVEHWRK